MLRPNMGVPEWLTHGSPSGWEDSGLVAALMLLPEPSLTSNAGRDAGATLHTGFFGTIGGAGSIREALPGVGPFLSVVAFSLSAEAGVRTWFQTWYKNVTIDPKKGRKKNNRKFKKASDKRGNSLRLREMETMSMEQSRPL